MQKYGTGEVLGEDNAQIRRTAAAAPITEDDVREIEREGETQED